MEHRQAGEGVHHRDLSWRMVGKLLALAAAVIAIAPAVDQMLVLTMQIVVAAFLAIAIDTVVRMLQRRGMRRGIAVAVVLTTTVLAAIAVVIAFFQVILVQGHRLALAVPGMVDDIQQSDLWNRIDAGTGLSDATVEHVASAAAGLPHAVYEVVASVVGSGFGAVTMILAVAFMLASGDQAVGLLLRLFPQLSADRGWRVVAGAYTNIGQYVVGATLQALCAGTALALVLLLLGVPYALALGLFMFIMDYVPLVGATVGTIPAVVVALLSGGVVDGIGVLVFIVIYQQVENAVIQPRIQGRVISMPGIAIFFSVLVGGNLFGVVGALFAVPLASIIGIMVRQYLEQSGRASIELPRMFDERGNLREPGPVGAGDGS